MSDGAKRGVNRDTAQQTFRQFAWHLASKLAETRPSPRQTARPARARGGAKR